MAPNHDHALDGRPRLDPAVLICRSTMSRQTPSTWKGLRTETIRRKELQGRLDPGGVQVLCRGPMMGMPGTEMDSPADRALARKTKTWTRRK